MSYKSPCSWGQSPARLGFPRQCISAVDGIGALRRCRPPVHLQLHVRKSVPLCSVQVIFMRSMLHVGHYIFGMNPTCRAVCSRAGTCIYTFACIWLISIVLPDRHTASRHGFVYGAGCGALGEVVAGARGRPTGENSACGNRPNSNPGVTFTPCNWRRRW